ncbi:MAG: hypothetical protein A2452_04155 [Candidatus Firestonebacteria bacterium RIFOXYC2_FULL_39_67]|nr:MAG: hypothetical protein A2536_08990 [Candidatus Firestonebacteria bacterium RIFOXYD2_FULL_39_29]OGF56155.1 MAG: hypothetical protein A2452_04155 [Candidatus Firestonebacteria bacterium RIFOXYC2_FULL_39_67]
MKKVKVGIIGLGRSGMNIHAKAFLKMTDKFEIVAVADKQFADRAAELKAKTGCAVYTELTDLIKDKNVEYVINATPSFLHRDVTIKAMEACKFVTVEKPIAANVEDADAMISAAKKLGKTFSVFQNLRWDEEISKLKNIMASGRIGEVYLIRKHTGVYQRRDDWQAMKKFGGGATNNTLVHHIDQSLFMTGFDVKRTASMLLKLVTSGDAEDFSKILVIGNKISIDLEVSTASAFSFPRWVIFGKYGTIMVEGAGNEITIKTKYLDPSKLRMLTKAEDIKPFSDGTYPSDKIEWKEDVDKFVNDWGASHVRYHEAAYDWIVNGKEVPVNPEETRLVLDLIEKSKKENGF